MRTRVATLAVLAVVLASCGAPAASAPSQTADPASSTLVPIPARTPAPTPAPTPVPTQAPTADPGQALALHIVSRLDELAVLVDTGDGDETGQWAIDEGSWAGDNLAALVEQGRGLDDYFYDIYSFLSDVADGSDQTESVTTLLASRNVIAAAFGLPTAQIATPSPRPAPITAGSYATLTSREWAKVVKAPDNFIGKGYKVWACITQFDAATGLDSFRAQASYRKENYWYTNGVNSFFSGNEKQLDDYVEDDLVSMSVVSFGSYSYDTQNGGNTTAPIFEVVKIARKGSC